MRVLFHRGQYDGEAWIADTKEQVDWAFLQLFKSMDKDEYYIDLEERDPSVTLADWTQMKEWHKKAKGGDGISARILIKHRHALGAEYEDWTWLEVGTQEE